MGMHRAFVGTLTILSGQTQSNVISAKELGMAVSLVFENAAVYTNTVTLLVDGDESALIGAMQPLRPAGAAVDVTLIAAKWQEIGTVPGINALAIESGGAEASTRVVKCWAVLSLADR
jgi:hypothetical protein